MERAIHPRELFRHDLPISFRFVSVEVFKLMINSDETGPLREKETDRGKRSKRGKKSNRGTTIKVVQYTELNPEESRGAPPATREISFFIRRVCQREQIALREISRRNFFLTNNLRIPTLLLPLLVAIPSIHRYLLIR